MSSLVYSVETARRARFRFANPVSAKLYYDLAVFE